MLRAITLQNSCTCLRAAQAVLAREQLCSQKRTASANRERVQLGLLASEYSLSCSRASSLTGIGVVASTDASVSTSFAEIYVSLSIFKLWRRPRYQIVAGINRYNYGAILQCAACNNSLFYGTEHRASNWAGLFYGKTKKKTSTKPPTTTKKTHKKYSSRPFGGQGESSEPR